MEKTMIMSPASPFVPSDPNYPIDLYGRDSIVDGDCNDTEIVDMGAYEFLRSDIDSSGNVNFKDFSQFALYWLDIACGPCGGADLTCDGDVNCDDLKELTEWWLAGAGP